MRSRIAKVAALTVMGLGAAAVVARELAVASRRHELARYATRRQRYLRGRIEGMRYRLGGRRPDPYVSDDVLTDRVRSQLGPLEKRLDLPHLHVRVTDHVAHLHGAVDTDEHRREIELAVMAVSGVHGVVSRLHVGLRPSDTRPSEGARSDKQSDTRRRLLAAAAEVGLPDVWTESAVRAALGALADRVPDDELAHLASHLPADVRPWCSKPRYFGSEPPPRTVPEFVTEVVGLGLKPPVKAEAVCLAVYSELQRLVPEEVADIAAVLPEELRDLWNRATVTR